MSVLRNNNKTLTLKITCFVVSSSSSVDCRAGDYELPPATTILCQFRQLARANHVVCVSHRVLRIAWKSLKLWTLLFKCWIALSTGYITSLHYQENQQLLLKQNSTTASFSKILPPMQTSGQRKRTFDLCRRF